jgi:hypothetical protein
LFIERDELTAIYLPFFLDLGADLMLPARPAASTDALASQLSTERFFFVAPGRLVPYF